MANKLLQSLKFPGLSDTYLIPLMNNFAPAYSSTSTYAVGDYCSHDNKFYVCKTAISTAEAWTAGHWDEISVADIATAIGADVDDLKEALDAVETTLPTKADKDGVVASAEQLLSDVGTEDKAPYLFRAVPYDSTRVDEEVVGATVGWNQLYKVTYADANKGITINVVTGEVTITGTSNDTGNGPKLAWTTFKIEPGHKVLVRKDFNLPTGDYIFDQYNVNSSTDIVDNIINIRSDTGYLLPQLRIANTDVTYNVNGHLMVFDLTAWFGSAIADYTYTLEQATAGSGVAFIKALLPGGYIPYSAPTLKSVEGLSGHKFVGFNQWDEEWEAGDISGSTGQNASGSSTIRSKNYIRVIPGAEYSFTRPSVNIYIYQYDADKNFIPFGTTGYITLTSSASTHTTRSDVAYLRFVVGSAYGNTYKNDICVNISDPAKNGTYEPYKATTYVLDSDLTLRGILKMDADHNVYADGDVYGADGTVTRKFVTMTLSGGVSEEWLKRSGDEVQAYFGLKVGNLNTVVAESIFSDKYVQVHITSSNTAIGINLANSSGYNGAFINLRPEGYADMTVAQLKTALAANPVHVIYELATPTTETALPYASPQNCTPGGTEEYVYAEGGSGVPVGHNSKYLKNMRSELERVSVAVPKVGSTAGTYVLKATVSGSGTTYAWVAE